MRSHFRGRTARTLAGVGLVAVLILPAAAPVAAADPVILRVGTTQDLDSLNPYSTLLVSGYEAFQQTYNLLVDFGPDLEPVPGFADSWTPNADGSGWTFHIRDGMKWSDGEPATAEDACFSWQLALDAIASDAGVGSLGAGYLDPGLDDAKVTKVECPDASTMIATTTDKSDRILQTYLPIVPKHIWGDQTYKTIGKAKFEPTLVGTGPYQAVEWQTGQFVRFQRNPNYWGTQAYPDEVVLQFFSSEDAMTQAIKAGEIDYAHNVNAEQFKALGTEPDMKTVVGAANGWTQLAFNTYGTGTGKTIKNGGPSTQALLDPAFRSALEWGVDHDALVDKVLGGYGDPGTTIVPPVLTQWHVQPDNLRTYDPDKAKQMLEDAGYHLDGSGNRLDKQGKPITLRMYLPKGSQTYKGAAQYVVEYYKVLGIKTTTQVLGSGALGEKVLPPEAGKGYTADYDIELWGWSGNVDPNALLQIFTCDAIGSSSDSQYCNPDFDKMYTDQLNAATNDERKTILAKMQNLIYDEAPYDILFYDANLDVYRTDRFAGWQNQPTANGTPFFTYSTLQYTMLTDATAVVATPEPSAGASAEAPSTGPTASAAAAATPAPSGDGSDSTTTSDNTPLILGILIIIVIGVIAAVGWSRRKKGAGPDDDDEDE